MPSVDSFTSALTVVATSIAVNHSAVDVGQWMIVQINMGGFGSRTAPPVTGDWRVLVDNRGFGSRRVSTYAKIKEVGDAGSTTFTMDIALSSTVTLGWGDGAAPVADWIVGATGGSGDTPPIGSSTTTVAQSVSALAGSMVLASLNEATTATETGPTFYTSITSGWTVAWQSNSTEWPIFATKAFASAGASGDVVVTYPNSQASGNHMGVQIVIPAPGAVAMKNGTFSGSITAGSTFSGQAPTFIPSELSVVGAPTTVGVTSNFSGSTWVLDRPSVATTGDVLHVELRSQNSLGPLPEGPAGWTLETDVPTGYTGPRTHAIFWHRIADINAEPASYTFTTSQSLRRIGVMSTLRAAAGKIIVVDSHSPLYLPSWNGGAYQALGWDVDRVPGIQIAAFSGEFSAPESTAKISTPTGFTQIIDAVTATDPASTSRTNLWVGWRKVTAEPMGSMELQWTGSVTGPGFDSVMFREITPGDGEGDFQGTLQVGPKAYMGGSRPPKAGAGFSSVGQFLATIGATSAHRGDSAGSPEMSVRGYDRAAARGYGMLEFSAQRTLDGVWVGSHDPDPNRTSGLTAGTLPNISTMTWAQLQQYENVLNAEGYPVSYIRMIDFLAKWTPTHIILLDPKNATAFLSEFNALANSYGGPNKIVMKFNGPGASTGTMARNWRTLGYETWGFFYQADYDNGDLALYQDNWTILGMEHSASPEAWAAVTNFDVTAGLGRTGKKPVMGHIAYTQAHYNTAMSRGAKYVQVAGTAAVAAVGAESTPIPGGTFGSPLSIGPGYVAGVAPSPEAGVIGFGRVRGRFMAGVADGLDVGEAPDIRPMTGTVTFRAGAGSVRVPTGTPSPLTLFLQNIVIALDSDGYIANATGGHDISLLATDDVAGTPIGWKWTATFQLQYDGKDVSAPPIEFSLPKDGLVDLSVLSP